MKNALFSLIALILPGALFAQEEGATVRAFLIADTSAVERGQTLRVALVLEHATGWHTYWSHPGDAGLPTRIEWTSPLGGVQIHPFEWPVPIKLEASGLASYVYEGKVALPFRVEVEEDFVGDALVLEGIARWLVCDDQSCLPGSASIALRLPLKSGGEPTHQDLFLAADKAMPQAASAQDVTAVWQRTSGSFLLDVAAPADIEIQDFFPQPPDTVVVRETQTLEAGSGVGRFEIGFHAAQDGLKGLPGLVIAQVHGQRIGLALQAPEPGRDLKEGSLLPSPPPSEQTQSLSTTPASPYTTIGTADVTGLFQAILWGILGGFILNLMPCVLPAISLKIVGFIQQAGESRRRVLQHGLAFCGGIFVWFLGLAGLVILFRLVGQQLQWAFQFGEPWAVFAMGAVLVAFALNLFGVFEIQLPGQTGVALSRASSHTGLFGSFFHGVFATILATPCMAPFLGTTLSFALAQPALVVVVVFGSIALGMAFPYLLLAIQPAWLRLLPKPGDWMLRLKEFMGFLLLATALWLLWLLGRMNGADTLTSALGLYLLLSIALWAWGFATNPTVKQNGRRFAFLFAVVFLMATAGLGVHLRGFFEKQDTRAITRATEPARPGEFAWLSFSEEALQTALRDTTAPIFIDFTADWCWTCKLNEQNILAREDIREAFVEHGVLTFKADFTNFDDEIKVYLDKFKRPGVPMYVFYPADRNRQPILLPELLTRHHILEGIRQASAIETAGHQPIRQ